MASTFLTRLKVGGKLVDAKGVSRLYRQSISGSSLLLLVLSAIAAPHGLRGGASPPSARRTWALSPNGGTISCSSCSSARLF